MGKHKRWVQVAILSAVVIISVLTLAGNLFSKEEPLPIVGAKSPNFSLKGLDGEMYNFSDYSGKPVLMNFWGSFCDPCVEEMPLLQSYHEQYADQGLVVLGLNLNEPQVTVNSFVKEFALTFPILLDKDHIRKQYGVISFPTSFFIDADGTILDVFVGEMKDKDLKPRVERLLADR